MVLDSISSPHRRPQNSSFLSTSFKKQTASRDTWSTLFERHRFLLTMLALLAFLCTIYLYFAITLGATDSCSGLSGSEKALCQTRSLMSHKGKLRLF
ncbi:hypothetical protein IHE45_03G020800 [Dioscorea alata]|uniref:Uncharacterized protein n=1 Tax=Dioscorea alata TaxID=55571 RepID=A0ACB7WJR1_DIOAL|nr:hypothetical protein IHE45_03G020800 [Dioscorea alata]